MYPSNIPTIDEAIAKQSMTNATNTSDDGLTPSNIPSIDAAIEARSMEYRGEMAVVETATVHPFEDIDDTATGFQVGDRVAVAVDQKRFTAAGSQESRTVRAMEVAGVVECSDGETRYTLRRVGGTGRGGQRRYLAAALEFLG